MGIGLCCRVGFPRRGTAAASLLPLLPLQACKAKDGQRRGRGPLEAAQLGCPLSLLPGRPVLWQGPPLRLLLSPPRLPWRGDGGQPAFVFFLPQ